MTLTCAGVGFDVFACFFCLPGASLILLTKSRPESGLMCRRAFWGFGRTRTKTLPRRIVCWVWRRWESPALLVRSNFFVALSFPFFCVYFYHLTSLLSPKYNSMRAGASGGPVFELVCAVLL